MATVLVNPTITQLAQAASSVAEVNLAAIGSLNLDSTLVPLLTDVLAAIDMLAQTVVAQNVAATSEVGTVTLGSQYAFPPSIPTTIVTTGN